MRDSPLEYYRRNEKQMSDKAMDKIEKKFKGGDEK